MGVDPSQSIALGAMKPDGAIATAKMCSRRDWYSAPRKRAFHYFVLFASLAFYSLVLFWLAEEANVANHRPSFFRIALRETPRSPARTSASASSKRR